MKRTAVRARTSAVLKKRAVTNFPSAELRSEIVICGQRMASSGLSPGKTGNLSARVENGMLITPTGMNYAEMRAADIVELNLDGRALSAQRVASSEWRLHLAIYRARRDVGAIVHTHSLNAVALACVHRRIPAFHYMVGEFGGDRIECAPYRLFGSEDLARLAIKALGERHGCLLANHGAIAVGATLKQAYERAVSLEALAGQYVRSLQIGRPKLLSRNEMARVVEKFKTYGVQREMP